MQTELEASPSISGEEKISPERLTNFSEQLPPLLMAQSKTKESKPFNRFIVFDESGGSRKILFHQLEHVMDADAQQRTMALGIDAFRSAVSQRASDNFGLGGRSMSFASSATTEEDVLVSNDREKGDDLQEEDSTVTDSHSSGETGDVRSDATSRKRKRCCKEEAGFDDEMSSLAIQEKLSVLNSLLGGEFSSKADILGEAVRVVKTLQRRLSASMYKEGRIRHKMPDPAK